MKEAAELLFSFFLFVKNRKCSFFDRKLALPLGYMPCPYAKLLMKYSLVFTCTALPVKDQKSGH